MATILGTFKVTPGSGEGSGRITAGIGYRTYDHSVTGGIALPIHDPILTAIVEEFATNGTLEGIITVTAA